MDDGDYSSNLLLAEDDQNDVESTRAPLSEGAFIVRTGEEALDYLLRSATYRSQAAESPIAGLPGLNARLSSAAERVF